MKQRNIARGFGAALRLLRETSGYTPKELETKDGLSRAHLLKMEQGAGDPKLSMLYRLADLLGIPFMALVREIDHAITGPLPPVTNIDEDAAMMDGILVVSPRGGLNALAGMTFFDKIFRLAQARRTHKILLNVTAMRMDFSELEREQLAVEIMAWLKKHRFAPSLAVVVLADSGIGPGAEMVRKLGADVRVFFRHGDALAWLKSSRRT